MGSRQGLAIIGLIVALLAASCGGSSEEPEPSGGDTATTTTTGSTDTSTTAPDNATNTTQAPPASASETSATVTIDGVDYHFGDNRPGDTCSPDFFGGFFAVLGGEDFEGNFSVELWNEGTGGGTDVSNASLKMEVNGETLDLEANPENSWPAAEAGTSFVDPFTYEGNTASGTIAFINEEVAYNADLAPLDPIVADFTVTCADG